MKVMDSCAGQGANHSHSRSYGADLQRGHAGVYALSCSNISGAQYQVHACYSRVAPTPLAAPRLLAYARSSG